MSTITDHNLTGRIDEIDRIIAECPSINEGTQAILRTRLITLRSRTSETFNEAGGIIAKLSVRLSKKEREYKVAAALLAEQ